MRGKKIAIVGKKRLNTRTAAKEISDVENSGSVNERLAQN